MQCFAFHSFKTCARNCRGSCEKEGKNETEDSPKVWGPDSSARELGPAKKAMKWHSRSPPEQTAWLLNCSPQRAFLWARTWWKITARKGSGTKRSLGLRPRSRQRILLLQEQLAAAPQCWEEQLAPVSSCFPPAPSWCSLLQLCHIPAEGQAESNLHSENLFLQFFSFSQALAYSCTEYLNANSPIYFQLPSF